MKQVNDLFDQVDNGLHAIEQVIRNISIAAGKTSAKLGQGLDMQKLGRLPSDKRPQRFSEIQKYQDRCHLAYQAADKVKWYREEGDRLRKIVLQHLGEQKI